MRIVFVFAGILKYKGRLLKQISTLQEAGHECILIHGQVEDAIPGYDGYPFEVRSIRLIRHPNKARNYYNHIRFNFQAANVISNLVPDAVVCVELYGALSGALARQRNPHLRFVFDCNELFMQMGMNQLKKLVWAPIHTWVFLKADVVMHAEEHRLLYCQQHYRSSAKHFLLENLPKGTFPEVNIQRNPRKPIRVVYVGALLPDRYCEEVITSFAEIPAIIASCDFIGFGEPEYENNLKELISHLNLQHVRILPPVVHNKMFETLFQYDVGLAFYENHTLNQYYCAPNKIYDYIACGLPVISNDYPGLKKTLEANNIGVCIQKINSDCIRAALEQILDEEVQKQITEAIRKRFSWENQASSYCALFD